MVLIYRGHELGLCRITRLLLYFWWITIRRFTSKDSVVMLPVFSLELLPWLILLV
ncbi:MAG: hypothetical protein MRERV_53c009 [Mycoplasmataceae bacterium RV_VA103A]|nr:MAG: hypothetical protein MRERV_53c009 [Mycoplasmataceae bacterium RV_VA103A]